MEQGKINRCQNRSDLVLRRPYARASIRLPATEPRQGRRLRLAPLRRVRPCRGSGLRRRPPRLVPRNRPAGDRIYPGAQYVRRRRLRRGEANPRGARRRRHPDARPQQVLLPVSPHPKRPLADRHRRRLRPRRLHGRDHQAPRAHAARQGGRPRPPYPGDRLPNGPDFPRLPRRPDAFLPRGRCEGGRAALRLRGCRRRPPDRLARRAPRGGRGV